MAGTQTTLKGIEQGRANKAYDFAKEGTSISSSFSIAGNSYKDEKFSSYVKKVPMQIKTNGLGATFAFIKTKCKKEKNNIGPGEQNNPKNAYDLIYKQTKEWLVEKQMVAKTEDLAEYLVKLDSTEYRLVTNEVLAFFNWLRRFAEGLDTKGE